MKNRFVNLPFRWRRKDKTSKGDEDVAGDPSASRNTGNKASSASAPFPPLFDPLRQHPFNVEAPTDLRCVSGEIDSHGRWLTAVDNPRIQASSNRSNQREVKVPNVSGSSSAFKSISHDDRARSRSRSGEKNVIIAAGSVSKFHSEFIYFHIEKGAFGEVYKAKSKATGEGFAIKRVRLKAQAEEPSEVKILKALKERTPGCKYLVNYYDSWREEDEFAVQYIQMELCSVANCKKLRSSLRSWEQASSIYPSLLKNIERIEESKPDASMDIDGSETRDLLIPESTIWKVFHDISCALEYIHSLNIVHQDVKLSNIMFLLQDDGNIVCKLGDFGIAGQVGSPVEEGEEGDFAYMPKEMLSSSVKPTKQPSTDIFCLGISIYELASPIDWILPENGPMWHDIRNNENHVFDIPSQRKPHLVTILRRMIHPEINTRPSISHILTEIRRTNQSRDIFLGEFISDVNTYEEARENELARAYEEAVQRCITPTDAMLSSGFNFMNVTPVMSTPSKESESDSPASPPNFPSNL